MICVCILAVVRGERARGRGSVCCVAGSVGGSAVAVGWLDVGGLLCVAGACVAFVSTALFGIRKNVHLVL